MKDTSWQVGYSSSGTGSWSVAGSASFSQSRSTAVGYSWTATSSTVLQSWQMNVKHNKIQWRCGTTTSPGPFYVYTVEPTSTDWQTRNVAGPDVSCNTSKKFSIAGNGFYERTSSSTSTYSGSASIYGFTGTATVKYASGTFHRWDNKRTNTRSLCGETNSVTSGNTRVSALA